jgi:hypothetical protein
VAMDEEVSFKEDSLELFSKEEVPSDDVFIELNILESELDKLASPHALNKKPMRIR